MINGLQRHLNQRELNALTLLLFLAVVPHFFNLSIWISLFFGAAVALRLFFNRQKNPFPKRWLMTILTLIALINLFIQYPIPFFRTAAVALLVSMLGLKLLEVKQRRDLYVVVFLGYFTLITQFLYRQDMLLAIYAFTVLLGLTAILVETSRHQPSGSLLAPVREALKLILQAVPVMIILFVFFPRLSGPLWNLGLGDESAVTGLSDKIRPGAISQLSQSREVAFRVHFEGAAPPPNQRYWRGPIFWDTDGVEWNLGRELPTRELTLNLGKEQYHYNVILEPTQQKWLFALDLPNRLPAETRITPDFQLKRREAVNQRVSYSVSSSPVYNTGDIYEDEWIRGLTLPDSITPRMEQLVSRWQRQGSSPADVVNQALSFFRQEPFYYTLLPPLVEENPADQFLFDTRRGFCEHYATSFTLLMRVAGIPARVVTGYQGGEINPMGDYLIVRQSDAHAWSEVWLEGQGWVRVDPTAAVAPERIERTFDFDLTGDQIGTPISFDIPESDFLKDLARQVRWGFDAINTGWHRWVLGYTHDRQSDLMQKLGLEFLKGQYLAFAMIGLTAIIMLIIGIYLWRTSREKVDAIQAAYLHFCKKLARRGVERAPSEGPQDFAKRATKARPDLKMEIHKITRLYIALRYGQVNSKAQQQQLQRLIRGFKA
ncbi:MAG: DUF3488 and transglutaminase-like domain-containing protein [Chromatiales bacterium]|nr:DUF3488 and transglutaminase-like domain-containing protein [Chromatiales bacterium]